jgi:hypothetical protein
MRMFLGLAAAVATLAIANVPGSGAAHARYEGPWCAHVSIGRGAVTSRCDMRSFAMCRAETMGMGGSYCTENPYYKAPQVAERHRKRVRHSARR